MNWQLWTLGVLGIVLLVILVIISLLVAFPDVVLLIKEAMKDERERKRVEQARKDHWDAR